MDSTQIINILKNSGNMTEVAEIKWFKGYRMNKKDNNEEITVKIFDMGSGSQSRYSCIAESDQDKQDKKKSVGNPDPNLEGAIENIHWWDFD